MPAHLTSIYLQLNHLFKSSVILLMIFVIPTLGQNIKDQDVTRNQTKRLPEVMKLSRDTKPTVNNFFSEFRTKFGMNQNNEFRAVRLSTSRDGHVHHRFRQFFKGIEIIGAQYILHEKDGFVEMANGHLVNELDLDVIPRLSEQEALKYALDHVGAAFYKWENENNEIFIKREQKDPNATFYPKGELLVGFSPQPIQKNGP